jgi:hypothetical protein
MMAWELLSLVDQVHNWAKTDHRTFVLEHLKAWHDFCSENYLLDWDSKYNIGEKRKRACKDDEDLLLPDWTKCVSEQRRQQIRSRAKYSLAKAQIIESQRKGKGRAGLPFLIKGAECYCRTGACGSPLGDERGMKMGSRQKLLDHLQIVHCVPVEELARVREVLSQGPPTPALEPTRSDQRRVGSYMNGIKRVMERCAPKDEAASLPEDHVQGDTANAHQESADEVLSNGVGRSKRRKAS